MKKAITLFILTLTIILQATAQETTFELVKDIFPNGDSSPESIVNLNDKLIFAAKDDSNGKELWISDGTEGGTSMLLDINTGSNDSNPSQLTVLGDKVIFTAEDAVNGNEVWVTDGTTAGTLMLKDINTGSNGSYAFEFFQYNSKLLFRADDGVNGTELWATDGTPGGTAMVKDVRPGEFGGNPRNFAELNGLVYFNAVDGFVPDGHGFELWVTDGTEAGTHLAVDINPADSSNPEGLTAFNGKLYFNATGETGGVELWSSDGTEAGTAMLKDINTDSNGNSLPGYFTPYNNLLFFTAYNSETGRELWKTDGTEAGTQLVKDIAPGAPDGVVAQFDLIVYQDQLYFTAQEDTHGAEIWVTDGTESNTHLFKDIFPGSNSSMSQGGRTSFKISNDLLYFRAIDDIDNYYQLWLTDGTENGTQKLSPDADPHPDALAANPYFTTLEGSLYFAGNFYEETGLELWKVTTIVLGTESYNQSSLTYYPNPVKHMLTFKTASPLKQATIYNLQGQKVGEPKVGSSKQMDLSGLSPGVYLVKVQTTDVTHTFKIVKD